MKIKTEDLERSKEDSTNKFSKDEVDIKKIELTDIYPECSLVYPSYFGFSLAENLYNALQRRSKEEKFVTPREADILCRGSIDLSSGFVFQALMTTDSFLEEGTVGVDENTWELRELYNKGLIWLNKYRGKVKEEVEYKAIEKLSEILDKLNKRNLGAWQHEIDKGFPKELLKPEYMTYSQYDEAKTIRKVQS